MRTDVVNSSICNQGRKCATAEYAPGRPGCSITEILASANGVFARSSLPIAPELVVHSNPLTHLFLDISRFHVRADVVTTHNF